MKHGGELVTFMVSDIMDLPDDYAHGCDLTYTDPPWEQSLVQMFETLAFRDGKLPRSGNTIDAILNRLFKLAPKYAPAYIEYSVKGHERVVECGENNGFQCTQVHDCVQTNGKPYVIVEFNGGQFPTMDGCGGWEPLQRVLDFYRPNRVFEPFAGHGQHTRRMVKTGATVAAAELNPARAAKLVGYFGLE